MNSEHWQRMEKYYRWRKIIGLIQLALIFSIIFVKILRH